MDGTAIGGDSALSPPDVRYATTRAVADKLLDALERKLAGHTRADPLLVVVDTETFPDDLILRDLKLATDKAAASRTEMDAYPPVGKCKTPEDKDARRTREATHKADYAAYAETLKAAHKAGLKPHIGRPRLLQFMLLGGKGIAVIDLWKLDYAPDLIARIRDLFGREEMVWVGQNIQFDVKMLAQNIRTKLDIWPARAPHCTRLAAKALESVNTANYGLAPLCQRYLGLQVSKDLRASDWARWDLDPAQVEYAARDVWYTGLLFKRLRAILAARSPGGGEQRLPIENAKRVYDLTRGGIRAVAQIELTGMPFDRAAHHKLRDQLIAEDEAQKAVVQAAMDALGYEDAPTVDKLGSRHQVSAWLEAWLDKVPANKALWPTTDTGLFQTGAQELRQYGYLLPEEAQPVAAAMVEWAKVRKAVSDYGKEEYGNVWLLSQFGRIFANFLLNGTETGRFSVTDPPLQTIPREDEFRDLFKAKPGRKIVGADYGQIELRVAAVLSQDTVLLAAIEKGLDIHTLTGLFCFSGEPEVAALLEHYGYREGEDFIAALERTGLAAIGEDPAFKPWRQKAKNAMFGLLYGQGPTGLLETLLGHGATITLAQCREIQTNLLAGYTGLRAWIAETRAQAAENDDLVWSPGGRVYEAAYTLPAGPMTGVPKRISNSYTKAINTPCQAGAAEVMLLALHAFPEALEGLDAKLIHVVHDEILVDAAEDCVAEVKDIVDRELTRAAVRLFPTIPRRKLVEGKIGNSWGEAK